MSNFISKTQRIVVVGASGFGRETLDVIEASIESGKKLEIVGVLDDAPSQLNLERLKNRSIPYLGKIDDWLLDSDREIAFVVGIGSPIIRQKIAEKFEAAGFQSVSLVHPRAVIGSETRIAKGAVICAGVVISTNVVLEEYVHVNANVTVGHDSVLEAFVSLNPGAIISGEVRVARAVLIGAGALVLQQLTIQEGSTLGAGAVVTKSVPSGVIVKGVPGRW
ncbi:acetyltransferase [Corynebacterium callunae]|uniref:acetyltransferase n=1 Tax=Corynebacterium callunae TaxID=1721 RepID=UPI001FFFF6CD|nr:acetyltransferase [Corynebacterium callunae]